MKAPLALVACVLSLRWLAAADDATPVKPPPFEIVCKQAGTLTATAIDGRTALVIRDQSGIGHATVRRPSAPWPEPLVLRAYLRGLEHLAISNGRVKLSAQVSAMHLLHLWKDGKEGPQVGKDSPYWTEIRIFDATGKRVQGRTTADGWFELVIPKAMLGESKELNFDWIDFYR
jgi:hypothetical protein